MQREEIKLKVEETVDKVKEVLSKVSTQDIVKGAVGGAIAGGLLMIFGKKKK